MSFENSPVQEASVNPSTMTEMAGYVSVAGTAGAVIFEIANRFIAGTHELVDEPAFALLGFAVGALLAVKAIKQEN